MQNKQAFRAYSRELSQRFFNRMANTLINESATRIPAPTIIMVPPQRMRTIEGLQDMMAQLKFRNEPFFFIGINNDYHLTTRKRHAMAWRVDHPRCPFPGETRNITRITAARLPATIQAFERGEIRTPVAVIHIPPGLSNAEPHLKAALPILAILTPPYWSPGLAHRQSTHPAP